MRKIVNYTYVFEHNAFYVALKTGQY